MNIKSNLLDKSNVADILPLNPSQEGLLFHYLNNREARYYCEQIALEVSGEMNPERMEAAWQELLVQHEALRAVFRWEKLSNPVQVILKDPRILPVFEDLSSSKTPIQDLQQIKEEDLAEGFDMAGVPLRLKIISIAKKRHLLLFSYHHILFDGWSLGLY